MEIFSRDFLKGLFYGNSSNIPEDSMAVSYYDYQLSKAGRKFGHQVLT